MPSRGSRASPHEAKPTMPWPLRSATQVAAPGRFTARRRRHIDSLLRPDSRAMTASGRMPAYVVCQLSRCTCAIAPASPSVAPRTTRLAATRGREASAESLDNALHRRGDVLRVDAEELVHVGGRGRFAEAVHAHYLAFEAHVLAPVVGHAGFDRDPRHAPGQHGLAVEAGVTD